MAKRTRKTVRSKDSAFVGISGLQSTGLIGTPLDVLRRSFRDTVSWLKTQPPEDFTREELVGVNSAGEAAARGELDVAIDTLRNILNRQELRRRRRVIRRALMMVRRKKQPTLVRTLLADSQNYHAVRRVNDMIEKVNQNMSEDILDRLKSMARSPVSDYFTNHPELRDLGRNPYDLLAGLRLGQSNRYETIGTCKICNKPAIGELRYGDGYSCMLCHSCISNANSISSERRSLRKQLVDTFGECYIDLKEAASLNPTSRIIKDNQRALDEMVSQLPKYERPSKRGKSARTQGGRKWPKYLVVCLLICVAFGILGFLHMCDALWIGAVAYIVVMSWPWLSDVFNWLQKAYYRM